MKIKTTTINGRKVTYGTGTPAEVEALNIEKDFKTTLKVLATMRATRRKFFNITEPDEVNRKIYGKRKASRE